MMYTLRTIDPTPHQTLWKEVDIITREALNCILGVPLGNTQWEQAQLPVSLGGLGLRSAEEHAPAAFAKSVLASKDLKERILNLPEQECPPVIPASLFVSHKRLRVTRSTYIGRASSLSTSLPREWTGTLQDLLPWA